MALSAGALTAACGGSSGASGERLRVAFAAGGSRENLDPHVQPQFIDQARARACFDTLAGWSQQMTPEPRLAQSWESDATGTRWNVRLRETRFHDGRPLTANDVLYSLRRITAPATAGSAASGFSGVDHTASRAVSDREVEIALKAPNFLFPLEWAAPGAEIVPAGATDFTRPIGCGPFRYESFTPGGPALYSAYEGFWGGSPPSRELEFVPIDDENARLGALLSGQIAYAHDLRAASAAQLAGDGRVRVLSAPDGVSQFLALKVDRPPFNDPRLVDAVRYGIDRDALARVVLLGRGQPGNDVFGRGLQYFDNSEPVIPRDLDRARAQVAAARATGLAFELQTSGADPNFEPASTLIAQQLGEIGLKVTPRTLPSPTYYATIRTTGVASHTNTGTLPISDYMGRFMTSTQTNYNFTGFRDPEIDRLYATALAAGDDAARSAALASAQDIYRDRSGKLVWATSDWNVGIAAELQGVPAAKPNSSTWARFDAARLG